MSLKPLQATMPLGQFDGLDSSVLSLKGGEVVTFSQVAVTADSGVADVDDGYQALNNRTVVTLATAATDRPLMLADEGVTGYGTLFGSVVGGVGGQNTSGTAIGPHTAQGSGKVTCWAQPGLYAVSLDAVHASLTPDESWDAGDPIYHSAAGLLCDTTADAGGSNLVVARFVEFQTNGSLVTTPNNLVGTFNPPDGVLGTTTKSFDYAVIWFHGSTV
jgi:hypothetical protein